MSQLKIALYPLEAYSVPPLFIHQEYRLRQAKYRSFTGFYASGVRTCSRATRDGKNERDKQNKC